MDLLSDLKIVNFRGPKNFTTAGGKEWKYIRASRRAKTPVTKRKESGLE